MILILLNGRLGNNLFQLAFGKVLEKNTGNAVIFIPKSSKIGEFKYFQFFKDSFFANLPKVVNCFWKLAMLIFPIKQYSFENQLIDVQPNLNLGNACILGYFQSSAYLIDNKEYVKQLFKIQEKYFVRFQKDFGHYFKDKRVLTIQVRLGDYLDVYFKQIGSKAFVGWDWFVKVLEPLDLASFDHIFLISDDVVLARQNLPLKYNNVIVSDGKEISDFQILIYSDVLVISNSSFAWWGAFLN